MGSSREAEIVPTANTSERHEELGRGEQMASPELFDYGNSTDLPGSRIAMGSQQGVTRRRHSSALCWCINRTLSSQRPARNASNRCLL